MKIKAIIGFMIFLQSTCIFANDYSMKSLDQKRNKYGLGAGIIGSIAACNAALHKHKKLGLALGFLCAYPGYFLGQGFFDRGAEGIYLSNAKIINNASKMIAEWKQAKDTDDLVCRINSSSSISYTKAIKACENLEMGLRYTKYNLYDICAKKFYKKEDKKHLIFAKLIHLWRSEAINLQYSLLCIRKSLYKGHAAEIDKAKAEIDKAAAEINEKDRNNKM